MSIMTSIIVNFLFFLSKNTLRYTRYKNNLKIFYKDIFGVMACCHLVSLYLLTHLSKLRFVIISTDTISACCSYYTPNIFLMFSEQF